MMGTNATPDGQMARAGGSSKGRLMGTNATQQGRMARGRLMGTNAPSKGQRMGMGDSSTRRRRGMNAPSDGSMAHRVPGARLKGQMVSTELVICSSIFMAALVVFLFAWNTISTAYYEEQASRDMETALAGISDMAVLSPGSPSNWEFSVLSNANSFGFATSPNVLSQGKLAALTELNGSYSSVKEKLGAGRFDISISVLDADGNALPYGFGQGASTQNYSVVSASVERLALLGGQPARLQVQLWRLKYSQAQ